MSNRDGNACCLAGCDEPSSQLNPLPSALKPIIGRESRTRQPSGSGCAGVLFGPGTVAGGQGQIRWCGVVQRPGVAAAIVSESEDGGEFQNDVGIGRSKGNRDV